MQNPFPVPGPGAQAISVTPVLLFDLLNTARNLCPQCYAGPQHFEPPAPHMASVMCRCAACGYNGPEGDWRVGWLCHTLRNAVTEMLRAAQGENIPVGCLHSASGYHVWVTEKVTGEQVCAACKTPRNENVNHAARPVNIGRNDGTRTGRMQCATPNFVEVPRMLRGETIMLCTSTSTGEHVWQPSATPGREHCRCGAWRTSTPQGSRTTHVPHTPGLVYVRSEGNAHATPCPPQGEGNVQHTPTGERSIGDTVAGELPKGQG